MLVTQNTTGWIPAVFISKNINILRPKPHLILTYIIIGGSHVTTQNLAHML